MHMMAAMKASRITVISIVFIAAFALASGQTLAQNHILNPGFETGTLESWSYVPGDTVVSDNGPSASGTYSALLTASGAFSSASLEQMPSGDMTEPLMNYSFDAKLVNSVGNGYLYVSTMFQAANGQILGSFNFDQKLLSDGNWHTFSGTWAVPPFTRSLFLHLGAISQGGDSAVESVQLDNVSLISIPEPSPLALLLIASAGAGLARCPFLNARARTAS
jgi:hypothetical protein